MFLIAQKASNRYICCTAEEMSFTRVEGSTYCRSMPKNVLIFEESSDLSVSVTVGGGVVRAGAETVELAAEGVGDARPVVEPEEA